MQDHNRNLILHKFKQLKTAKLLILYSLRVLLGYTLFEEQFSKNTRLILLKI